MLVSLKSVAPQDTNSSIQSTVPSQGVNGVNPQEISEGAVTVSPVNLKRRDFFLELSRQLAKEIYARNPEDNSRTFSKRYYMFNRCTYYDKREGVKSLCRDIIAIATLCTSEVAYEDGTRFYRRRFTDHQSIPEGIRNFADSVATGLVYQYQDHVPILTKESCARLTDYFVNSTLYYAYSQFMPTEDKPDADDGTYEFESSYVYDMLMHKIIQPQRSNKTLQTENGLIFSINHLMSTGFRTLNGQSYIPSTPENVHNLFLQLKEQANFPLYRYGTAQTLEYIDKNIEGKGEAYYVAFLGKKDITFISETEASPSKEGENQGAFWRKAEALAQQYLTSAEYTTLTNSY